MTKIWLNQILSWNKKLLEKKSVLCKLFKINFKIYYKNLKTILGGDKCLVKYFIYIIYCMTKKTSKIFCSGTLCTKKPFNYRVVHHKYLLTSCQGQDYYFCS